MAATARSAGPVTFSSELEVVASTTLIRLPEAASRQLPSRGQVAVSGSFARHEFATVIEPDGRRGHWLPVEDALATAAKVSPGDAVEMVVEPAENWPEPRVPSDLAKALKTAPQNIQGIWEDITPMARWEWVRWIGATKNPDTRAKRIRVSIDKMGHGKRRPCCFDLASCTDPHVAKSGKLPDPA
jgi:hypothetical protein